LRRNSYIYFLSHISFLCRFAKYNITGTVLQISLCRSGFLTSNPLLFSGSSAPTI